MPISAVCLRCTPPKVASHASPHRPVPATRPHITAALVLPAPDGEPPAPVLLLGLGRDDGALQLVRLPASLSDAEACSVKVLNTTVVRKSRCRF